VTNTTNLVNHLPTETAVEGTVLELSIARKKTIRTYRKFNVLV